MAEQRSPKPLMGVRIPLPLLEKFAKGNQAFIIRNYYQKEGEVSMCDKNNL